MPCSTVVAKKLYTSGIDILRLPTYDDLSRNAKQLEVYETPARESVFVVGPPGSGKTVLAIHRSMLLVEAGCPVVFITFNRMLRRLTEELAKRPIQAMTMHKFVSRHYQKHKRENAPRVRQYIYDWSKMRDELKKSGIKPEAMHLVVDEGQDLPNQFYQYMVKHVASNFSIFADEDQTITKLRSSLRQIKAMTGLEEPIILNGNHRNTPHIASVAQHFFVGNTPVPIVHRSASGELPRFVPYVCLENAADRIANWNNSRGGRIGVVVARNDTGSELQRLLQQRLKRERVDMYSFDMKNEDSIDILAPGITVLNEKSVKGQEFDTVFVMEIDQFLMRTEDVAKRTMYMLCSRARDNLFLMSQVSQLSPALMSRLPGKDILLRP